MQARVRFGGCARNPLRRSRVSSARNAGESAICEITADRACRVREMQVRARFVRCPRDPLRRSCVSSARNAGESVICEMSTRPSAEIVRVECAKCRPECDWLSSGASCGAGTTSVRGVAGELEGENWRPGRTTLVRGVAEEWEDENWRVGSIT